MAHSTNYLDTFICVAEDTKALEGVVPPERKTPSIAMQTFELLDGSPYAITSDDLLFFVHAARKEIPKRKYKTARLDFFNKPQACLRCSPLAKQYGWGIHHDEKSRIALVGMETKPYAKLAGGKHGRKAVAIKFAMKSRR